MTDSIRSRVPWQAVRALCSAGALFWVLRTTPLHTIVAALRQADWLYLLAGIMLNLLARFASAERTQVISRALGLFVSRWQTIETLFISNFYALVSPGPVLSGVVSVYRYRSYGASITGSVGSLLASRAVEGAAFIALGTACVLIDSRIALVTVQYPLALAIAAVVTMSVGLACWWLLHKRWTPPAAENAARHATHRPFVNNLRAVWHEVMSRGPSMAWQAAIPATAQVVLSGAAVSVLAKSLGIELSVVTAIWVSAAVYAVVLLPISVAGLGVREVTLVKALGLLGVSSQLAIALSVLLFVDPLVNALIGGLWQIGSTVRGTVSPKAGT
jgi:glycosyltransferase 2 family protein